MNTKNAYQTVRRFLRQEFAKDPELARCCCFTDMFTLGPNHDPVTINWFPEEVVNAMATLFSVVQRKAYEHNWRPQAYVYWSMNDYGISD